MMFRCIISGLCLAYLTQATSLEDQVRTISEQLQSLKAHHMLEITHMKRQIDELKSTERSPSHESEMQAAIDGLKIEVRELYHSFNHSRLIRDNEAIKRHIHQILIETSALAEFAKIVEERFQKLDNEVEKYRHEGHQIKNMFNDMKSQFSKLSKEVKTRLYQHINENMDAIDDKQDVIEQKHKLRHNKMMHVEITRLSRVQEEFDAYQHTLKSQMDEFQRRLEKLEEPNWFLLSAKQELTDLEVKVVKDKLNNASNQLSDLDKVHTSVLELREDLEGMENKFDKTIPEFRKEISKLDVNFAQLNAHGSYLKEDQENLRQSVKAIAVSVSNAIDRAQDDRLLVKRLNKSVEELRTRARQHFYRLNDHILKSEANHQEANVTKEMNLSDLIGEVMELQPVEHEYVDLVNKLPRDCSSVDSPPGAYLIHPGHTPIETWCDNGTTLLQRRFNGSIEFNRKFKEYVKGFGIPASEYWMGLESMHQLTANNCSGMRIDMEDIYGAAWYAEYQSFTVGSADTGYVLDVSGFKGNASDAFDYQNHMEFSAIDHDRDISNTHCAGNYEGGWWFSHCQHVNINGKYGLGLTWFDSGRNEWIAVSSSVMTMFNVCH